jgi:hypothetical protein
LLTDTLVILLPDPALTSNRPFEAVVPASTHKSPFGSGAVALSVPAEVARVLKGVSLTA